MLRSHSVFLETVLIRISLSLSLPASYLTTGSLQKDCSPLILTVNINHLPQFGHLEVPPRQKKRRRSYSKR